jgi:GTPase SAR1 family protein
LISFLLNLTDAAYSSYRRKKTLFKIVILGEKGVGKSAILSRYVEAKFQDRYKPTIGMDFLSKQIEVDDHAVTLQIWVYPFFEDGGEIELFGLELLLF